MIQDLATEVILTLGQAFEVAYQLVLRQEIYSPSKDEDSSQMDMIRPVRTVTEPAKTINNNKNPVDGARKIGPKPTVLPPKPKLGMGGLKQRSSSNNISHARSHSSVDRVLAAPSPMAETRLHSESNLASLQAKPAINSAPSSASVSSTGSGRLAPLAAKDEL